MLICAECKRPLETLSVHPEEASHTDTYVLPCANCLTTARRLGQKRGYQNGLESGREENSYCHRRCEMGT